MKKIAVGIFSAILVITGIQSVNAQEVKTIAIIDTAIDSSKFSNVVYEACFTQNNTCPNKAKFQEGAGAANVSNWKLSGIDHGHNVAQAAVQSNPNIKIVFVRYNDELSTRGHGHSASLSQAFDWVAKNSSRFGIGAVSISQSIGQHTAATCVKNTDFNSVKTSVDSLSAQNVLVFAATGNDKNKTKVGFPACVDGVIGVGAIRSADNPIFASYTNRGPGLDIVARGDANIVSYSGVKKTVTGTSIATPIAAVLLVTNMRTTLTDLLSSLPKAEGYPFINN